MMRAWQRELRQRDNAEYTRLRGTPGWFRAIRELQMNEADLHNMNYLRLVLARAQAIEEGA